MKGSVDRAEMHTSSAILTVSTRGAQAQDHEIAKRSAGRTDCYIELVIEDSYYNMHEQVIAHPHVVDIARRRWWTAILNRR